jgi:hypothetical protein
MTASMCPSLRRLASLLRTAYRSRDSVTSRKSGSLLAKADRDIFLMHQLITRHRASCSFCKLNEAVRGVPSWQKGSHSSVVSIDRVH